MDDHSGAIEAVIHMGAISATTETDVDMIIEHNFQFSCRLWDWCAAHNVPFIYASSAATYGDGAQGFNDSQDAKALAQLRPLNPYGWSKHLFDRWVLQAVASGAPQPPFWAGYKFFNVYGPNEYHKGGQKSVITSLYPLLRDGGAARLFKSARADVADGAQARDFVWVGDCVSVMLDALKRQDTPGIYNIGCGQARTFNDLAHAVFKALNMTPRIEYIDMPEALKVHYQYYTQADLSGLRTSGYTAPMTTLEDGVVQYVQTYLAGSDPYV